VSPPLVAIDRYRKLKAVFFFVRDVRQMREIDIADRDRPNRRDSQRRGSLARSCHADLGNGFVSWIGLEKDRFGRLDAQMEVPRAEAMAVGVDQVPGDELPNRQGGRSCQVEVSAARELAWHLSGADDRAGLETVARQETLRG
jgi:hypothetical protein